MSNFPTNFDDDTTLPIVNDNITEIGAEAINALREAVFNIEQYLGLGADGYSYSTVAARLGVSILPDGTINPSAITGLGLVTLPITDPQISASAQISESKLLLDHSTQDLFNFITNLNLDVNASTGWISSTGVKLEPHLVGVIYRHTLSQVDVTTDTSQYLKNKFDALRNNTNSYTVISDINDDLVDHQLKDGSPFGFIQNITTHNGSIYPSNYGHTASGIFLNTERFSAIPQTAQDLQTFAQFIDSSSIFLYGTRIQNLYTNGISRASRSSSLSTDGYGAPIVPATPAIAYLLNIGSNSAPFDDINAGDDIIELKPSAGDIANNSFDEKFALVRVGDIIRINYGSIEVGFIIKEKKYIQNGGNKKFIVRIAGKNIAYAPNAVARIDRPLFNNNKFGVLAIAAANNEFSQTPSLIIGSPSSAMALGNGFKPDQLNSTHYLLYLVLYPTGHASDGYVVLPGIDITGNAGVTPGQYTLTSVVESTNNAFRRAGYNYRFISYEHQGNFGIMLSDSYNNAGFSIANAVVGDDGQYDLTETNINFPNNVVDVFSNLDPLGFGITGANIASPLYQPTYNSAEAAINATKLFLPLRRNNYYVNGAERDKLKLEVGQILDGYGDGYWEASVLSQNVYPGPIPIGRVQTTYRVMLDLSARDLKVGKTLVIQGLNESGITDFGRFIIQDINFGCYPNVYTDITVFDAVHGTGFSPTTTLDIGSEVALYFNTDSVSFNIESATDFTTVTPFKRHFEVYVDLDGNTFTHERARMNASSSNLIINGSVVFYGSSEVSKLEIIKVSPKLRGYQFGSVNKITLVVDEYDSTTGIYLAYLTYYDGISATKRGPFVFAKLGEITRFYDETNVDYIDLIFGLNTTVFNFTSQLLDIQLFPTLSLDEEVMLLATCQLNDVNNVVSNIKDQRQFGNTSEKDLSTSALDYIAAPERLLHANGVIRGFDITDVTDSQIDMKGGQVLVNGKIIDVNPQTINIPLIKEISGILYNINWAVCINDKGEVQNIPLLDYDSTLPTPTNILRLFHAYNVISGTTYILDSTTFTDLIVKRKDLTVLYVVTSIVTTPTISIALSILDARKYIYNETELIPLTWAPADVDVAGHFKTIHSVITWANKFGSLNNVVKVRGEFNFEDIIDLTSLEKPLTLIGENAVFNVNANIGFFVKSNITFDGITFNYTPSGFPVTGNINGDRGCILGRTYEVGNISNINIRNCTFTSSVASHPPYISFRIGSNEYVDSVDIINNKFDDSGTDNAAAIAFVGTETSFTVAEPSLISNINVSKNYCHQNQVFYFVNSFSVTGNSYSIPGLSAVNVKIFDNKAGYVGYTISGNDKFNTDIVGQQLFSIERNELIAVVGPLDETGKNPNIQAGIFGATGPGLPSGNVVIIDNDLSFISSESRGGPTQLDVDGYIGNIIIDKNRLFANNYETKVFNIFGTIPYSTSFTSTNVAISLLSRLCDIGDESIISAIITNNVIQGRMIDEVFYGYAGGIFTKQSSLITGNTIKGLVNVQISAIDAGFGIIVDRLLPSDQPHSKIHFNSIYRTDQGIYAYVRCINNDSDITDNFFDASYIDAAFTDERVVRIDFLSERSIVDRNKNQIITLIINGTEGQVEINNIDLGSGGAGVGTLASPGDKYKIIKQYNRDPYDSTLAIFNCSFAISTFTTLDGDIVIWTVSLKDYLPQGITILSGSTKVTSDILGSGSDVTFNFERKKTHTSSVEIVNDTVAFFTPYVVDTITPMNVSLVSNGWQINKNEIYNALTVVFNVGLYTNGTVCVDSVILKCKW